MFAAVHYMAQRPGHYENWSGSIWRVSVVLEKNGEDKMVRESTNEVLRRIGEKATLVNNILSRKANWFCNILRTNCLLHDATEG